MNHLSTCSRGFAKRRKQRARKWVFLKLPFRMPLDAQREVRCVRDSERLDDAIRRACFDDQVLAARFDSLPVQGIDRQAILSADLAQSPSRLQETSVSRPVLRIQRSGL